MPVQKSFAEVSKCEYPLPLPENQGELAGRNWRENGFQTKDFYCAMDNYCIRADGNLWQQAYVWETTRKGRPCRKPGEWQPLVAYTGTVRFYDSINGNKADYWVEWEAVFVSGKVTELKLLQWEERDNHERLECEARWKSENEKRDRFLATWFGRRVYPGYAWLVHGCLGLSTNRFWQWVGSRCQRVGNLLDRLGDKLTPYGDPIRSEQRRHSLASLFDEDDE